MKLLITFFALLFIFAPLGVSAQLTESQRRALETELEKVEAEIREQEKILQAQKAETASLAREQAILSAQIQKAKLTIQAKNLEISRLTKDITTKEGVIGTLSSQISRSKEAMSEAMRQMYEVRSQSFPEMLLAEDSLGEVFSASDRVEVLSNSIRDLTNNLESDKSENEGQKVALQSRRDAETNARAAIEKERKEIERLEAEQKKLVALSKEEEQAYEIYIQNRSARAAQIRSMLFELRDTEGIPFGQAYEYAVQVSAKTGVRPAFLLAILQQESAFGKNVGSCLLTDYETGMGIGINSGVALERVMNPTRDVPPFIDITTRLGLDPKNTRISCPQSFGWGGAMGPAQFIASTWVIFEDRLKTALNVKVPNPWTPLHAFMASGMYLTDLGAGAGTYTTERNAACRYYSGAACGVRPASTSYGDSVMSRAANIQANMIDLITN